MSDMNQRNRASDPTTPAAELQQLATDPELRPLIAKNPAAYPELLAWLASKNEPAVTAALQEREGASLDASVFPVHEVPSAEAAPSSGEPLGSGETPDTLHNPFAASPDAETPDSSFEMPGEVKPTPQRTSILGGDTAGTTPDNYPEATTTLPAQDSGNTGNPPSEAGFVAAAGTAAATIGASTPNYPDTSATAVSPGMAGGDTAGYYPANPAVPTPAAPPASPAPTGYDANSTGSYAPGTPGAPGAPAGAPPAYPAPAGYAPGTPGAPGAYPAYPTTGSVPVIAVPAVAAQKSKSNTVLWIIFAVLLVAVVGLAVVMLLTFLGGKSDTAAPKETTSQTVDEDSAKDKDTDTDTDKDSTEDADKDKDDKDQKPEEREIRFPAPAGAQSAATFTTKTGNTTCSASGNTLTCAVKDHEAQIGSCDSNTSAVVTMQDGAPEISCQMKEQYSPGGMVPEYNQSVNLGDFVCTSLYDYTECWNVYTGTGFQLARQMYQSVQY